MTSDHVIQAFLPLYILLSNFETEGTRRILIIDMKEERNMELHATGYGLLYDYRALSN